MKPTTRELLLPRLRHEARVESFDSESRSVILVAYAGAVVERVPLFADPFKLSFSLDPKGVNLSRLRSGARVTKGHADANDVDSIVGVTSEPALSKDGLRVRARFSKRADLEPFVADVRDGIVKNVSVEAEIHALEDVTKKGEDEKHYHATSWTPVGVAFVGVGADAAAQVLADGETFPCTLSLSASEKFNMDDETTTDTSDDLDDGSEQPKTKEALRAEIRELRRQAEAHRIAAFSKLGDLWARRQIDSGATRREMIQNANAEQARLEPEIEIDGRLVHMGADYDSPGARIESMAAALCDRITGKPSPQAGRYGGASIVDCAFDLLRQRGHGRGLDPRRNGLHIVELAHTTSDFPLLLGNVLNKRLLPAYENAQPTFSLVAARREFTDFRPERFLRGGDFPIPLVVGEGGEIQHGTMSESQELVSVLTYARIFGITRQALVNDDLGFFETLAVAAAQRVADLHNSLFFSTCITAGAGLGPNLSDGVAVYNSAHGNVASAGALSNTLLGEARSKMMSQTSLDGLKLNVQPRYLLTSPASLTLAETLLATIAPTVSTEVNPFAGRIIALGDANLSGTRFYVLADPARLPQYIFGSLRGEAPLRFDVRQGWENLGIEARVVSDFGVGAIESRAGVTGAGA